LSHQKPEWKVIIDLLHEANPVVLNRIARKMMHYLFKHKPRQMEKLILRLNISQSMATATTHNGDNQPSPRVDNSQIEKFVDEIFELAAQVLQSSEISRMLSYWIKEDQFRYMTLASERRDVPLSEISEALNRFCSTPGAHNSFSHEERIGIRAALIRRFLSEDLDYVNTMKHFVSTSDFSDLLSRTIGPAKGNGKLGGKAAGLFRAEKIIMAAKHHNSLLKNLRVPKTWFLASDSLPEFLHYNALEEMQTIKYRDPLEIRQEYNYLGQMFKNSALPPEILDGVKRILDEAGDKPLIVRSSSLLEDARGQAFAGKYKSLFVANQGTKQERLDGLTDAILEVFASTFGPDPIEYRRERRLLDFNEEMAMMIQEVVGQKAGKYYFPAFSGVAFSCNEFRWSPRIGRNDGIIRLVTGFGTRAVDRIGDDYPLLISPGQPGLRVNQTPDDCLRYSQKKIDVINLETRRFETLQISDLLNELGYEFPSLSHLISFYEDRQIYSPVGMMIDLKRGTPFVSFANLLQNSDFIAQIKTILGILKETLGWPVDIEFACSGDVDSICLLQCRPQSYSECEGTVVVPQNIAPDDQLFTARKFVTTAQIHQIEYIVYVDPMEYDRLSTLDDMSRIGTIVSGLNERLPQRKFILMGPGRWGSRGDIKLGVKVAYSDINNTAMLIEIARAKMGYIPELSFGTHFFLDLVEANIRYLPLYPDDPDIVFNETLLRNSPNVLRKFLPEDERFEKVVKVISIPAVTPEATLSILMDGDTDYALAFINRSKNSPVNG